METEILSTDVCGTPTSWVNKEHCPICGEYAEWLCNDEGGQLLLDGVDCGH